MISPQVSVRYTFEMLHRSANRVVISPQVSVRYTRPDLTCCFVGSFYISRTCSGGCSAFRRIFPWNIFILPNCLSVMDKTRTSPSGGMQAWVRLMCTAAFSSLAQCRAYTEYWSIAYPSSNRNSRNDDSQFSLPLW